MGNILTGKKTYIAVIAGLIASIALFVQKGDFSWQGIMQLIQGDAVLAAIAFARIAISKKA